MKKKLFLLIVLIFCLFTIVFVFANPISLKKGNIDLDYGKKYKEPGYSAKKFGKDLTKKVKVKSYLKEDKLGVYKVVYSVEAMGINYKRYRKISVVDKEKPVIALNGDKKTYICPGAEYKEEGYKATDNFDKDLTKKVKTKTSSSKIVYTVKDSSLNVGSVTRHLIYEDKIPPELNVNTNDINLIVGNNFNDEYGAVDNCDGDITASVVKEGSVDTSKVGSYTIKYVVKDKAGNEASKERKINVINKPSLNQGIPGTIYLTFDDGPKDGTTNVILDILKEEGVKATFFVTNNGPDSLIKREYDEGHTVALHTATHDYSIVYASDESYYQDLANVQARVKRITGETSMIIRFPGGSSNTVSRKYSPGIMSRLTQSTLAKGYKYYDWNISSGDAGGTTEASGVYNNVIGSLRKDRANMILMHDIKTYTRDALRQIITFGKQNGYNFERITMDTPMITQGVNN